MHTRGRAGEKKATGLAGGEKRGEGRRFARKAALVRGPDKGGRDRTVL